MTQSIEINKENVTHFYAIDIIKIIACFLVIVNHTTSYILTFNNEQNIFIFIIQFVFCRIAVPLFIMCSGFLMYEKSISFKYILDKIIKLLLIILTVSFITFIFKQDNISIIIFFKNLISNPVIEPYWYLYMLIGLYLLMPILSVSAKNFKIKDYKYTVMICLFLPSILYFISSLFNFQISNFILLPLFSYLIGYYYMGMWFKADYSNWIKIKSKYKWISFIIIYFISIYLMYIYALKDMNKAYLIFSLESAPVVFLSVLFMMLLLDKENIFKNLKNKKAISAIATLTLFTYIIHPLIQNKIYKFVIIQNVFEFNPIIGLIILQIIIFFTSLMLSYFLKKIPYVNKF